MKKFICMLLFSLSGFFLIGCNDNSGFMEGGKVENKSSLSRIEIIQTLSDSATPRTIPLGFETAFQAQAIYSNGEVKDVTETVKWSVDGMKYQSRMANGSFIFKANSSGNVIITAEKTEEGKTKMASTGMEITDANLAELQIKPAFLELPKDVFYDYRLVAIYSNGMQQTIVPQLIEWSVSDDSIAEFQSGRLYTRLAGEARIVAKYEGFEVSSELEVKEAAPLTLMVANPHISLTQGSEYQLKAYVSYDNGSVVDVTSEVQWTSDSPSIFDFDHVDKGKGTARSTGATILKAQFTDPTTNKKLDSNTVSMIVTNEIVSLVVHPIKNMVINTFQSISAELVFANGGKQDITNSVVWDIGDSTVLEKVSVDRLQAKSRGNTEISARFCNTQNKCFSSRTFNVTVENVSLTGIEMAPSHASVNINTDFIFSAVGRYSDNTLRDITTEVAFNSANNLIGEFTDNILFAHRPTGLSTPLRVDVCHVESGLCDSGEVEILDKKVSHIMITPARLDATKNVSMNINALAVYNDGSSEDITSRATWTHTHADASIQDQGTGKIFHARDVGNAIITARFSNVSASVPVTVNDNTIAKITVTPGSVELYVGIDNDVSAIAVFNDNSVKDISSQVSWRPSDNQIYQPNPTINKIRTDALISGPATLKAVYQGIESDPVDVKVAESLPKQLIISPNNIDLRVGTSIQLSAHIVFHDGNIKNVTKDVVWDSKTNNISINNLGVLSGRTAGNNIKLSANHPTYPHLLSNEINLSVKDIKPISLIVGSGDIELYTESEYKVRIYAVYEDGVSVDVTDEATLGIDDVSLGTISNDKTLSTNAIIGSTTYRASWRGLHQSASITVKNRAVIDLVVYPSRLQINQSENAIIEVYRVFEGGVIALLSNYTINIDNQVIAQNLSPDTIYGRSQGQTSATITDPTNNVSISLSISVTQNPSSLSIFPRDKVRALEGASIQYNASFFDSISNDRFNVTRNAKWVTDKPNIVSIDKGLVIIDKAAAGETISISASMLGRDSETVELEVVDINGLSSCQSAGSYEMCNTGRFGYQGTASTFRGVQMCGLHEVLTGFNYNYTINSPYNKTPGRGLGGICSTVYPVGNMVKTFVSTELPVQLSTMPGTLNERIECPSNEVLVQLDISTATGGVGPSLSGFNLKCRALSYDAINGKVILSGPESSFPDIIPHTREVGDGEVIENIRTYNEQVIAGYQIQTGEALDSITIYGAPLELVITP